MSSWETIRAVIFCWEFIGYPVVPVVTAGFLQGTVYRGLTEDDEPVAIKVLF